MRSYLWYIWFNTMLNLKTCSENLFLTNSWNMTSITSTDWSRDWRPAGLRVNRREMDLPYGICEKEIWAIFDFRNRWTSIVKKQIPNTYFQSERTLLTFLILKLRLVTRASYFLGQIFYFNWQVDFKTLTSGQKTMPTQKLSNQT